MATSCSRVCRPGTISEKPAAVASLPCRGLTMARAPAGSRARVAAQAASAAVGWAGAGIARAANISWSGNMHREAAWRWPFVSEEPAAAAAAIQGA